MKRILILAANPGSQRRLDQEVREIQEGLARAKLRDAFELKQKWAIRPRDVQRAILEERPNIVHFCGEGAGQEGLFLEDEAGQSKLVTAAALAGLFKLFSDPVECVLLNACYSEAQAEAIRQHVPFVIGMSGEIAPDTALAFARGFYDALGAGNPIEFAYRLGCNAIDLEGIPQQLIPVLLKNEELADRKQAPLIRSTVIPHNLPRTHVEEFVGRSEELAYLDSRLQDSSQIAIAAVRGMGGIGKTELALQYALEQLRQEAYEGGICWIRARETEIGSQIVAFYRSQLGLNLPEGLNSPEEQVGYCWSHWREGRVLIILDDVTDYRRIEAYLPPQEARFKLLATTRLQLGRSFQTLEIKVLSEDAALNLLRSVTAARSPAGSLTDNSRINIELEAAKQLCVWLGYLPLGLELVGRYLAQKPDLSLAELQKRLDSKRLNAKALQQLEPGMTATLNITAAFELSWQQLDAETQTLCYLLSLFALAPIAWNWVEQCFPDQDAEDLEDLRDRLVQCSFLQRLGEGTYILHQLTREFFQAKAIEYSNQDEIDALKRSICHVMAEISRTVPERITLTDVARLTPVMLHLESIAHRLIRFYTNENLLWAFTGVARFYEGQGFYRQAEPWYTECRDVTTAQLGPDHPDVATSLNNLAGLYKSQGRYGEAEPLYERSLAIYEQRLGQDHPDVATSLSNLALLYKSQGRYGEAEPLYERSLAIREQQLGQDHPDVATSLNNLAGLYRVQGRYGEAESFFLRSLQIFEQRLGVNHPYSKTVRSNLEDLREAMNKQERSQK